MATNPEPAPETIKFEDVPADAVPAFKAPIAEKIRAAVKDAPKPAAKSTRTPTNSSKAAADREMETARQVMRNLYDAAAIGLLFVNPDAAKLWASKIEQLDASNESAFAADADLRRAVVRFGAVSGKAAFVTAHVSAVVPVAFVVATDLRAKRAGKPVATARPVPAEDAAFLRGKASERHAAPPTPGPAYPNQAFFEG